MIRCAGPAIVATACLVAGCSSDGGGPTGSPSASRRPASTAADDERSHVGDSQAFQTKQGFQYSITLVATKRSVRVAGSRYPVKAGNRLFAAQFTIANSGGGTFGETPRVAVRAVDSAGRTYRPTAVTRIDAGSVLPATVRPSPVSPVTGWLAFEVPSAVDIVSMRWTPTGGPGAARVWAVP